MLLAEILAPIIVALLVGYGGVAYRLGLPSPLPSKHDRALTRIAKNEVELRRLDEELRRLGVYEGDLPPDVKQLGERVLRGKQLGIDLVSPVPSRNMVSVYGNAFANTLRVARGYDGPALTDEDVRRLEHPEEFK